MTGLAHERSWRENNGSDGARSEVRHFRTSTNPCLAGRQIAVNKQRHQP